jgi:hypothetical protein
MPTTLLVVNEFQTFLQPCQVWSSSAALLSDVQRASEASHNLIFVVSSRKSIKISCHSITQEASWRLKDRREPHKSSLAIITCSSMASFLSMP